MKQTFKIQIKGLVQGVGFRPFIFNLATQHSLNGVVTNNEQGVLIYINSSEKKALLFLNDILKNKPEVAVITEHDIQEVDFNTFSNFSIIASKTKAQINTPLTPDFAICKICKTELSDSKNRRFNYGFTTCTHCGPRYAITKQYPFERMHTSLSKFTMCKACNTEYTNPKNKRFHSQTNSCPTCGVQLQLVDNSGKIITENQESAVLKITTLLSQGHIVAIKNTNGYLLCCNATNKDTINELRKRKKRPRKPFAVLYSSIKAIKRDFFINSFEEETLLSKVAPIVIVKNKKKVSIAVDIIAPNLDQTGVMLPASALLELIVKKTHFPIVATSGNIHGSSIIATKKEAEEQLKTIADYFLHHNLAIQFPQDDSVIKYADSKPIILRRSRGLAPNISAKTRHKEPILAMGAHLKSTITFTPNAQTYTSQYFGNLDNYTVLERYKNTIEQYVDLFKSSPKKILVDTHPQYQSSILGHELALKWNSQLQKIQHHKAHFCSVLGENDLFKSNKKILGVIWDGTGLGDDNHIWGGEFFSYQHYKIERLTHFEYFDWLANDKMAKEPRLALLSLLDEEHQNLIKDKFTPTEWKTYLTLKKTNKVQTSSVGRLFDAVASALNLIDNNTFEAEAAMQIEYCANTINNNDCIDLLAHIDYDKIPSKRLVNIILKAYLVDGVSKAYIARSFIYTLAKSIIYLAKKNNVNTVACSGGVFQNTTLINFLGKLTQKEKINLKLNCNLSANDENISYGQLMYHLYIKN
ncbi:carbamoyltransferase HypF [Tenacibaculum sp. UWU-22]|uniref:carbamoyltransferase HypF n=1 Tax=Tenacibaculum sp. UWU-22 TaxID=3234187 RepID=UPI0034DB44FB